jgi:hypothetical protein
MTSESEHRANCRQQAQLSWPALEIFQTDDSRKLELFQTNNSDLCLPTAFGLNSVDEAVNAWEASENVGSDEEGNLSTKTVKSHPQGIRMTTYATYDDHGHDSRHHHRQESDLLFG